MTFQRGPTQTLQDSTTPLANSSSSALSVLQLSLLHSSSRRKTLSAQHSTSFHDIPPIESYGVQLRGCENTNKSKLQYPVYPTTAELLSPDPKPFDNVLEGVHLVQSNAPADITSNSPTEPHLADIESSSTSLSIRPSRSHDRAAYTGKRHSARHTIQKSISSSQLGGPTSQIGESVARLEQVLAPGTHNLQCNTLLHPQPHTPKKFRSYYSFHSIPLRSSSLRTSSTSTTRLPRYLGNHSQVRISPLGRSLSLTLPQLEITHLPRRAHSLPRILEHRRSTSSILYINTRVGSFNLAGRTRTIHRQHSSHRHEHKVPVMTPHHYFEDNRRPALDSVGGSVFTGSSTFPGPVYAGPAPPKAKGQTWKKVKKVLGAPKRAFKRFQRWVKTRGREDDDSDFSGYV